ncbi:hypothetical protein TNCV_193361 [Trichonephila clavipes]|nr:hypothetical protein TNCV_193361 [Trichonephila clavipes]
MDDIVTGNTSETKPGTIRTNIGHGRWWIEGIRKADRSNKRVGRHLDRRQYDSCSVLTTKDYGKDNLPDIPVVESQGVLRTQIRAMIAQS